MRLLTVLAMAALALAPLGGCGFGGPAASRAAESATPGYAGPPTVSGASRGAGGGVSLAGRAQPGSHITLAAVKGGSVAAAEADASGAWRAALPPTADLRLLVLRMTAAGRTTPAEGYIAVLPEGRVALLRSGAGALVVGAASNQPRILAIDFDRDGAAVLSGVARPDSGLQARVDRTLAGDVKTGKDGRFSIALTGNLGSAGHLLDVAGEGGVDNIPLSISPTKPLTEPFVAVGSPGGWRIDWMTPGGGTQTTLLLARQGAGG